MIVRYFECDGRRYETLLHLFLISVKRGSAIERALAARAIGTIIFSHIYRRLQLEVDLLPQHLS
jgi:hypothetical protein